MTQTKENDFIYKIIIIGDPKVGKTSSIIRFVTDKFENSYKQTIGTNIMEKKMKINSETVNLMIWDISGHKQIEEMYSAYFNGADGAILMYDITRPKTLKNISDWFGRCISEGLGGVPMILVGNKIDLPSAIKKDKEKQKANEISASLFQISAKIDENVQKMFRHIASQIHDKKSRGDI